MSAAVKITYPVNSKLKAEIMLPSSKSISNRCLMISAIGGLSGKIHNLSNSDDTVSLLYHLTSLSDTVIDAGDGGTTSRFLLSYLCLKGIDVELRGSESLSLRPFEELVDALNYLGAGIVYSGGKGHLPLRTGSGKMHGGKVEISGEISSQFISSLMMIAPYLDGGLEIELTGEVVSWSYILMTAALMRFYGVEVIVSGNHVTIKESRYISRDIVVEADWSAASYWYAAASLAQESDIVLSNLSEVSLQGDAVILDKMKKLGVDSVFIQNGVDLKASNVNIDDLIEEDFLSCPDLGPAFAIACAGNNILADLTGLKNFRLKESDRAVAIQRGLYDLNVNTDFCGGSKLKVYQGTGLKNSGRIIRTYNDHRIAMAFSVLAIKTGEILLDDYKCVSKSYPEFFNDLIRSGFGVVYNIG